MILSAGWLPRAVFGSNRVISQFPKQIVQLYSSISDLLFIRSSGVKTGYLIRRIFCVEEEELYI